MTLALLLACSQPAPAPVVSDAREGAVPVASPQQTSAPRAEPSNRPPVVKSVSLSPRAPTIGDTIRVDLEVVDPEGGALDYDYQWVINDQVRYDVSTETLAGAQLTRGDKVSVEVVATDGPNKVTGRSKAVTVQNTPPEITADASKMRALDGFKVSAKDADGDALSWRVEGAPRGLTVDPVGVLNYEGAEDEPGGDYEVVVVVDDNHGGFARLSFGVNIAPGRKAGRERVGSTP